MVQVGEVSLEANVGFLVLLSVVDVGGESHGGEGDGVVA